MFERDILIKSYPKTELEKFLDNLYNNKPGSKPFTKEQIEKELERRMNINDANYQLLRKVKL